MTRIVVGGSSPAGLRRPHYVNGRLLTAEDLTSGHDAGLTRDRWLGIALGGGVAQGLEVTGSPGASVLHVSPGTGVSPGGTAVHLDAPAALDLTAVTSSTPGSGSMFADCRPPDSTTSAPTAGAYVLSMCPASSLAGKVPAQGGPNADLPTPCASRWEVEEVMFSAIRLDGFTATTTPANRRNLLAHWCFGSASLEALAMSGFTAPVPYRGIDLLADLTPGQLPLAVFDWDGQALSFVDLWSARRRPVRPAGAVALAEVVGDDRIADGEARFLQFQDQLAGLLATPAGTAAKAVDVFPLLPPAGLVPFAPNAAVRSLLAVARAPGERAAPAAAPAVHGELIDGLLRLHRSGIDETAPGRLGALSRQLRLMTQDIDALRAEVDALTARLGGRAGSADQPLDRQLAVQVLELLADTAADGGVDPGTFFAGVRVRVGVVDHETVDFMIRRSWYDEPVATASSLLNVFFVLSGDGQAVAPYLLFAKRQRGIRWIDRTGKGLWT